jgi:glycosyltransferase involved in cell wall biosynthesis
VVHDLVLHHLLVESTLAREDHGGFRERLLRAHPQAADALTRARGLGISGPRDPFLFPATTGFVGAVAAVVVHSHWAHRELADRLPQTAVERVGLSVADPMPVDRDEVRASLGLAADQVVLMHLGFLTPEKGVQEILGGVAAATRSGVPVQLVLVGEGDLLCELGPTVDALGLTGRVMATGWVASERLRELPAAADLGVVLRTPSAGETSAAAIRFLACGTPVAVGGVRQFLEWPERAAPRLTPGPAAAAELARLLASVAADRGSEAWNVRREAAREAYLGGHRPADAARQLVEVVRDVVGRGE